MEDPNLSAWLAEDESHPKAFERYQQIWEGASSYIEPETFSTQAAWNKVDRQIRHRQRTLRILWNVGYTVSGTVASLLILSPSPNGASSTVNPTAPFVWWPPMAVALKRPFRMAPL